MAHGPASGGQLHAGRGKIWSAALLSREFRVALAGSSSSAASQWGVSLAARNTLVGRDCAVNARPTAPFAFPPKTHAFLRQQTATSTSTCAPSLVWSLESCLLASFFSAHSSCLPFFFRSLYHINCTGAELHTTRTSIHWLLLD